MNCFFSKHFFIALIFSVLSMIYMSCENREENSESEKKSFKIKNPDHKKEPTSIKTNEKKLTKKSDIKVTFVELGSVRCIPCKMMQPIMREIENEYSNQVKVVFYDVWTPEGKPYARKYGIRVIPTQVFLDKNDKEYFRHEGFFPKEELVEILQMKGVK